MSPASAAENVQLEMTKAEAALRAARALLDLDLGDDAVSRAYYAAYHAAVAVLYSSGLQARTHAGTHDLLFQHFVSSGRLPRTVTKDLAALQRYREQADYSAAITFDAASAREEVDRAERVVEAVRALLGAVGNEAD